MRVVVSVGGSVLVPSLETERIEPYAKVISTLLDEEHELGIVVGGGPVARQYIEAGRELDCDEMTLDYLGIDVTRLNARLLAGVLQDDAVSGPVEDFDRARDAIADGRVPILGGTVPGHTTDAVGTSLAEYVDADRMIYATSVSGVFDADPGESEDATQYDQLSPDELVDLIVDVELSAGSNAPVDLLAAKLLQRSGIDAVVLDGTDPSNLSAAIDGTHDGTVIKSQQ